MEKQRKTKKKSQQEIIGFVLIIVIVSVIGVVFLSLSIGRGEPSEQTSIEVSNLLESSMYYTTDCAVNFVPQYKNGQDLVKACWNGDRCLDENNEHTIGACEFLNNTLKTIIEQGLEVCDECVNKAYKLNIYYSPLDLEMPNEEVFGFNQGVFDECKSTFGGSHSIYLSSITSGTLNLELEVCRG
tara:strand:+ start:524 stop:1078 length:555 start_codon:yes stop_codon:yes gene_type:complete